MKFGNFKFIACAAFVSSCLMASPSWAGFSTTTTVLSANKTNIAHNEDVTLTATVTNADNYGCVGTVTVQPVPTPSSVTCAITITAGSSSSTGSCTVNGSALGVGTHDLGAVYGANGICPSSTATTNVSVTVAPASVPTTSEWTLWGLATLMLVGGGVFASRRFRATT